MDMQSDLYIRSIKISPQVKDSESYISDLPVVKNLLRMRELSFNSRVVFFVGENGTGKSTLLEAVAVAMGFNAEGGTKNFNFSTRQTHSELCDYITLSRSVRRIKDGFFLRAESFYNVASEIDRLDAIDPVLGCYGGKSLHEQSHGESFLSLVVSRFGGSGVYILDEPEAALSPSRQMALLAAIDTLVKADSQFIIATHSPILMAYPNAEIFVFTQEDVRLTPYTQTEHYILTKQFLNKPEKMLDYILTDNA
jgi:predicted ATPase